MYSSSYSSEFNQYEFKKRVDTALEKVRTILDNTRNPQYPADVHHEYEDKYILSEFLATSTLATFFNSLEYIGLSGKPWEQVKEWSKTRSVTLRLRADEACKFNKKVVRDVESDTKNVHKGIFTKSESYTVTKVTEYLWDYSVKWELVAFVGVDVDKAVVLQAHSGTVEVKTSVEASPKPENVVRPHLDVNITWLLQHTDDTKTPKFAIDRKSKKCRTPRRNPDVDATIVFLNSFHAWAKNVCQYFRNTIFNEQVNHNLDVASLEASSVFVPNIPLFEDSRLSSSSSSHAVTSTSSSDKHSSKIPPVFINSFLAEQARTLEEKRKEIAKSFPANDKLVTVTEANLIVILAHLKMVSESYVQGVDYIEDMLMKQLVAAIGKVVTPADFSNYLAFHNRKIFNEAYRPQAFSFAIRRPDHYPEGVLSIEAKLDDGILSSPITTIVAESRASHPMHFSLNAATKVAFFGERFLHGYVSHQFAGDSGAELNLYARARQFSSFILLVGRIVSADLFEPKYATIIQNKDELKIPLLLETIPTPKEFKDAIESLSPEQQRFCKAFRSMQLESTLFGVCVLQIKPQLEKLLKLPDDSLTKEIQLSQDLLNLFIKYQIPSDLVSYDGPVNESVDFKTGRVKEYVSRMHAMLEASKKAELDEALKQQQMRLAQQENDRRMAEELVRASAELRLEKEMEMIHYESASVTMAQTLSKKKSILPSFSRAPTSSINSIGAPAPSPRGMAPGSSASFGGAIGGGGRGNHKEEEKKEFKNKAKGGGGEGMRLSHARNLAAPMPTPMSAPAPSRPPAPPPQSNYNNNNSNMMMSEVSAPVAPVTVPSSAPLSQPQAPPTTEPRPQQSLEEQDIKAEEVGVLIDYTKIPIQLEQKFEEFDENNALRPTIINPGNTWDKTYYKSLLSEAEKKTVGTDEQGKEKNRAFDLLDALTKSGALSVDYATLHVVIASTHCFDKSIINTVVQDNINPIEKVENSALIIASTIHQTTPLALVAPEHLDRITTTSARLFSSEKNLIEMPTLA